MRPLNLTLILLSSTAGWALGNGIIPLLPVYAKDLGATTNEVGAYLSFCYVCLCLGVFLGGLLCDRIDRRKRLLIMSGAIAIPATFSMGMTATLWQLTAATAALWFGGGMGIVVLHVITGALADCYG